MIILMSTITIIYAVCAMCVMRDAHVIHTGLGWLKHNRVLVLSLTLLHHARDSTPTLSPPPPILLLLILLLLFLLPFLLFRLER